MGTLCRAMREVSAFNANIYKVCTCMHGMRLLLHRGAPEILSNRLKKWNRACAAAGRVNPEPRRSCEPARPRPPTPRRSPRRRRRQPSCLPHHPPRPAAHAHAAARHNMGDAEVADQAGLYKLNFS
jgi:hypothetical protein